jgi:hypothetical protein
MAVENPIPNDMAKKLLPKETAANLLAYFPP